MYKKKLHILFLNSWYPSKVFPFNGDFIQRHATAVAENHRVTSIHVITNPKIKKNEVTEKVTGNLRELIIYLKPFRNPLLKIKNYFFTLLHFLKEVGDFDIIHVNRIYPIGLFALYLKYTKKHPYIISEHFTGYLIPQSKNISKLELTLSKIIVKNASFVCPVSKNLQINMLQLGLKGKYRIVPNVVDTTIFFPIEKHHSLFTIIHISSLVDHHKNISGLLYAISEFQKTISEFKFYLIGENPFQYIDLIRTLNINPDNIVLVDQVSHDKVATYLQKSDVLVLFSNYENLPCVILEAFATGVKVISTDVGGINEFFPRDFGILIQRNDKDLLIKTILKLHNKTNKIHKEKMHQYAIDQFSNKTICEKFESLYNQSINND